MRTCDVCSGPIPDEMRKGTRYCSKRCKTRAYHASGKQRENTLRWKFGIEVEDYDRLFAEQGGVCAVCGGGQQSERIKHLDVDHDHVSGRVRGLLCRACNQMVGHSGDDPDRLDAAARYLRGR